MQVVDKIPRQVEKDERFWVLGIVEDAGEKYIFLRHFSRVVRRKTVEDSLDPRNAILLEDGLVVGFKDYIEQCITNYNLLNDKISIDLEQITDDTLHAALQKFFMDKIIWAQLIEINKRAMDERLKGQGGS